MRIEAINGILPVRDIFKQATELAQKSGKKVQLSPTGGGIELLPTHLPTIIEQAEAARREEREDQNKRSQETIDVAYDLHHAHNRQPIHYYGENGLGYKIGDD